MEGSGSAVPQQGGAAGPFSDDEEMHVLAAGEEPCPTRQLCGALAAALVTRSPLPGGVVPPVGVSAFALALAGGEPDALVHVPVMEDGRLRPGPLEPAGSLPAGSAAWAAYEGAASGASGGRGAPPPARLVWRRSSGAPPAFPDWRALLDSEERGSGPRPSSLVTVPIGAPGGASPLGAATFCLVEEPSEGQVEQLAALGACLACSITHQTKILWEESLGFLNQVIPRRVAQRMLGAAISLGPLAAAQAPAPEQAAAAAAAVVAEAAGADLRTPAASPSVNSGSRELPNGARLSPLVAGRSGTGRGGSWEPGSAPFLTPSGSIMSSFAAAEVAPAEPAVVDAASAGATGQQQPLKPRFSTLQAQTDLQAFRSLCILLLLLLFAALLLRGSMAPSGLAVPPGLLLVAGLGVLLLIGSPWFGARRSVVVASVRVGLAALLLLHIYVDPAFYSGHLLKGLAGACAQLCGRSWGS